MAREGDLQAAILNHRRKSKVARWVEFFAAQYQLAPKLSGPFAIDKEGHSTPTDDPGISAGFARAILEQVRAAKQKRLKIPKDYPPSHFTVSFRLQPFVRPTGEYDCLVRPTSSSCEETMLLLKLADTHQLHRLRRCQHCRKWHFARREAQRFCGVNCRVKAHVSLEPAEVRKRKRAEYMRRYREREKALDRQATEHLKKEKRQ